MTAMASDTLCKLVMLLLPILAGCASVKDSPHVAVGYAAFDIDYCVEELPIYYCVFKQ